LIIITDIWRSTGRSLNINILADKPDYANIVTMGSGKPLLARNSIGQTTEYWISKHPICPLINLYGVQSDHDLIIGGTSHAVPQFRLIRP
jgi:hypothetical protein